MTEVAKHKASHSDIAQTPCNPPWRVAYPHIFKKKTKRQNGADLKTPHFVVTLIAPKLHADPYQCSNFMYLHRHMEQAAGRAGWGQWPVIGAFSPIQDGDTPFAQKTPAPGQPVVPYDPNKYAWRRGNWIIEATSYLEQCPVVAVLQNGHATPIPAQSVNGRQYFKSGDYAVVSLNAYTFHNEKFGVNFSFEGVTWVAEGELIGASGQSAAAMFAGISLPAGFTPIGASQAPAAPTLPPAPPSYPTPGYPAAPHPTPGAPGFVPSMAPAAPVQPAPIAYPSNTAPAAPVYAPPPPSVYPTAAPPAYPAPAAMAPPPAGLPPFPVPR